LFSIQRRPGATRGAEWVWRRRRRDQLFQRRTTIWRCSC